ncbi:MAG: DNA-processing protein DprA [bacterium]|nr:DNA-processing protein DprA [bacterium]
MDERNYWLGFSIFSGIGPKRFSLLLEKFGNAKDAWRSARAPLAETIGRTLADKFVAFRESFLLQDYLKRLHAEGVSFLTLDDKEYSVLLKQIKNPPFVLYVKGNIGILHPEGSQSKDTPKRVAIVGTRKITSYGRDVSEMITTDLVHAGCIIVSGLALGVDAVAHKTALENKGKTVAVLGCGVDLCYPVANQALYNSILTDGGTIVSEYPLGQQPSKGSFPSRNRIIAGLSEAVVVTEGTEDSGALITAEEALKNGRKVFAVPGPITSSLSKGPLKLLQQGAKLVTGGEDILKELHIAANHPSLKIRRVKGETKEEQMIIDLLEGEALFFDELVKKTKIPAASIGEILSLLEVKGFITNSPDGFSLHDL